MEEEIMARQRAGKIKQVIALMLVSILLVFSATGCGKTSSAKKEEQIVFRMAIVDGEASPIYKGAKKMADEILKKTNGLILSRLVDTFSSRILYPMLLLSGNHSIAVV